jgi:hypothetical protein
MQQTPIPVPGSSVTLSLINTLPLR